MGNRIHDPNFSAISSGHIVPCGQVDWTQASLSKGSSKNTNLGLAHLAPASAPIGESLADDNVDLGEHKQQE